MKNKILISILATLATVAQAAKEFDIVKGLDITALTNVTASQLNQLVDNAQPSTNKGLVIYQNSTPATNLNPRYSRYIWADSSSVPPSLKTYNIINGLWENAAVGNNSVTTPKIADNAVTSPKIYDRTILNTDIQLQTITDAELAPGTITSYSIATNAIIAGKLAGGAVVSGNIATNSVYGVCLVDASVIGEKIAMNSISNYHMSANSIQGTNIATNTIQGYNIANGALTTNNFGVGVVQGTNIADATINSNNISTNMLYSMFHRVYGYISYSAGTTAVQGATVATNGTGLRHLTFTKPFANTDYVVLCTMLDPVAAREWVVKVTTNLTDRLTICANLGGTGISSAASGVYIMIYPNE